MAKKKKHEEHENLERWLVSYADFMTLLFATFVVLYALSQADAAKFQKLGESLKGAFAQSVLQGSQGILESKGANVIGNPGADSMMQSLIFEYMNPKYEESSMDNIQKDVNSSGDLGGVKAQKEERGLVITMSDKALQFKPGSAELTPEAKQKLDKIGVIIGKRFIAHSIRIEGHTDNIQFSNAKYPSNWELSSARASSVLRYLVGRFKFSSELFTAVGFADTRPKAPNDTPWGRAKNRSVDIVILKNEYKNVEDSRDKMVILDKKQGEQKRQQQLQTINAVLSLSDAAKQLQDDSDSDQKVIKLK